MLVFKRLLFLIMSFAVTAVYAGEGDIGMQFKVDSKDSSNPSLSISIELPEVQTADDVVRLINLKKKTKSSTVIISSDDERIYQNINYNDGEKNIFLAPYSLVDTVRSPSGESQLRWSKFTSLVRNYPAQIVENVKNDKLGFMILTINTAHETFIWMHTSSLSQFDRTASVAYTIAMAVVFGIDKEAWSKTARPFKKFFQKIAGVTDSNYVHGSVSDLTIKFFASLGLATSLNLARVGIISLDNVVDSSLSMHALTYPLLLSLISSVASFSWSEHIALIKKDQPISRFMFRRLAETRSLMFGMFATTAQLLNPEIYGVAPWAMLLGFGGVGITVYMKSEKLNEMIDKSPFLNNLLKKLDLRKGAVVSCKALFAS